MTTTSTRGIAPLLDVLFLFAALAGAQVVAYAADAAATPAAPTSTLRAGFARADITPAPGAEIPGGFGKNLAKGTHDPLWAEAAYFANGATELAVVGLDAAMIPREVVVEARSQAEAKCGMPGANIMMGASHTHSGGPIVECFGSTSDPAYCQLVAARIAEAVAAAKEKAVEARVSAGSGQEGTVGFNRRFKMKDGSTKTHPGKMNPDIVEPEGPIDPEVAVIAVQNLNGEPLGCIVNYALHGTTMGGSLFSADWPCYMRQTIRGGLGADIGVVFLNGACGDVTQVDNRNPRTGEFGEAWSRRCGMTVGAEALKVLARAEYAPDAPLGVASEILPVPIRELAATNEELVAREAPAFGLGSSGQDVYLREAALVREMKAKSPTVDVEVQAFRIGQASIVANPTEYFCALGLAIKQGSPWKPTLVAELADGYNGYSPTAEAFKGGGYETRTARSSYIAPGSGEQIADLAIRLLKRLAEAAPAQAPAPGS